MLNVLQRHWFTTVYRETPGGLLKAKTVYCGTDGEMGAILKVVPETLKITDACWEHYSPPVTKIDINELIGVEAYLNSGPALKEALKDLGDFPRLLFAETVRGVIQAETFIWEERGFASLADYSSYWEKMYANSCRYYSNLDRVGKTWGEYVHFTRSSNLFNRFKSQLVYQCPDNGYRISGQLSDSFHEVSVDLTLNQHLEVIEAQGKLLRAPDDVCREATKYLHRLPGQAVNDLNKKHIVNLLGQGNGCVHLIDVVHDAMESIKIVMYKGVEKLNTKA
jgi:hypothetical protein